VAEEDIITTTEEEPSTSEREAIEETTQEDEEIPHEAENTEDLIRLRTTLEERDTQIATLEEESERLRGELESTLHRYRASLLASASEIPEELVQGGTTQEMDEAFARARAMVERIRGQVEGQTARERVPAGAPARSVPDLSSLSAREKIAYDLAQR